MGTIKCTEQRIGNKMRKANVVGKTIEFSHIGQKTFDENSCIEVEDDKIEEFLKKDCGFKFEVVSEGEVDNLKEEKENQKKQEHDLYKAELDKLEDGEIEALLSAHPLKETKKLTSKDSKIEYLVKKQFK